MADFCHFSNSGIRLLKNGDMQYGFNVKSDVINGMYLPYITSLEPNSPAKHAGVSQGDYIVAINGIKTCGLRNKTIVSLGTHLIFLYNL